ncbi:glycerophosphoryl diester phosphodiesterase [Marinomonas sp. 15G1-11]|uniref:Glycerophosphoryl diester phosphodiesterase n=1 Tax=Marinomonas phaeophyticola TaxID=3004091 RepID=A0ABT4JW45_9GAMM|nr:glycerophosphoryl diester phosphodiesterase [Marinomonas sp. 15G1-11]MCZ2722601.1 glycerophosphoryl diester phosphodiesterase [Marinomonas sp. 15G1-11]
MLDVKVVGHRGAALLAPENTLAAIKAGADAGVKWVEIDVYLVADDGLVIFHDETLDRCTTGEGTTSQATLSYIQSLDAGSWFGDEFIGEKVPTLVEALTYIQSLGLGLNLEIKFDQDNVDAIVPGVLAELDTHWQDNEKLIISSFNKSALEMCYQLSPTRHLAQLYEAIPDSWQEDLAYIKAYSLHCDYSLLTESQAKAVKAAGYKLLCYTANTIDQVADHWHWGMDAIITDDPNVFLTQELILD